MSFFVYIVQCRDKTFYTGYSTDIKQRIWDHNNSSKGARYTKTRRPVSLKYTEACPTKSHAMKREYAIKQLSRAEKLQLIKSQRLQKF